jgi:hypothetical protein
MAIGCLFSVLAGTVAFAAAIAAVATYETFTETDVERWK